MEGKRRKRKDAAGEERSHSVKPLTQIARNLFSYKELYLKPASWFMIPLIPRPQPTIPLLQIQHPRAKKLLCTFNAETSGLLSKTQLPNPTYICSQKCVSGSACCQGQALAALVWLQEGETWRGGERGARRENTLSWADSSLLSVSSETRANVWWQRCFQVVCDRNENRCAIAFLTWNLFFIHL